MMLILGEDPDRATIEVKTSTISMFEIEHKVSAYGRGAEIYLT